MSFNTNDVLGQALMDYQQNGNAADITTVSSLHEKDTMPIAYLFRNYNQMPFLEKKALQLCKGSILDIGCGAGCHSLHLQEKGFEVTALDRSHGAIEVCKKRGVNNVKNQEILDLLGIKFDTLLLLMNGIGLVGSLKGLRTHLAHFKNILLPKGQVLMDSSNILYMYKDEDEDGYWIPGDGSYYGEVEFTMKYKGKVGKPFHWLYVDFETLKDQCSLEGFNCELVSEGEHYDYLARLTPLE